MAIYGTAAGFRVYHAARGNTVPASAADDATVEAALLVASEYIDNRFRGILIGYKTAAAAQVREWPRVGAYDVWGYYYDPATVPDPVTNATYEVALRQLTTPGSLRTDLVLGNAIRSVSVDGAVSITYAGAGLLSDTQLTIPIVAEIMSAIEFDSSRNPNVTEARRV